MTKRKFYRATYKLVLLSEKPFTGNESLQDLSNAITDGDDSGSFEMKEQKTLNGKQAAKALMDQESDPSFFRLDDEGNDAKD